MEEYLNYGNYFNLVKIQRYKITNNIANEIIIVITIIIKLI